MYNDINQQLEEVKHGMDRLNKLSSILKELLNEKLSIERKLSELEYLMDKENLDVEKLEKRSLASIFYSFLGKLEDHVEKEKSEALAAKLKYEQAVKDLNDVNNEISKLSSEKAKYIDCESKYESLYALKKDILMNSDPEKAQCLLDLTEQINTSKSILNETKEAISAGNSVISSLDNALNSLDSAESWGTFDLLGGGLISDLAKHSHIDDATYEVEQTQILLRRFKTELSDIKISDDIYIETDGFTKFADIFFDGLIADWVMQSKIKNSYENVSDVKSQVQSILNKLNHLEEQESSNIKRLELEMNNLIIKA